MKLRATLLNLSFFASAASVVACSSSSVADLPALDTDASTADTSVGGSGGSAGSGGGTSGTGGSAGNAGSAGTGGSAGSSCGPCDDNVACTLDSCEGSKCIHTIGPNTGTTACQAGYYCDLQKGCVQGQICATTDQCVKSLGADPCKTSISCDPALAVCVYKLLDKDGDSYSPIVCGGLDCDDSDAQKHPGLTEICDGKDNNCNSTTDESATCPALQSCQSGSCVCPAEKTCGSECVDKSTDPKHCGSCTTACPSAATCTAGQCVCSSNATACPTGCVDIFTDTKNCGACGAECAPGYSCVNKICSCTKTSCGGTCVDTSSDPKHCGNCTNVCSPTQTCAGGKCMCPNNQPACKGLCVNYESDNNNCGNCGNQCASDKSCQSGTCQCKPGTTPCNGSCIDSKTDPLNCGVCGKKCDAGKSCVSGNCTTCQTTDLLILLDHSGSTATALADGSTRLTTIVGATKTFINDTASQNIGVSVQHMPIAGAAKACTQTSECASLGDPFASCTNNVCVSMLGVGDSCLLTDYAKLPVGFALLSSAGQINAITSFASSLIADGNSPLQIALKGTLSAAKLQAQNTGHRVAVVALTDSIPNTCDNATVAEAVATASSYYNGNPKIPTFIVGVGTQGDQDWQPVSWAQIATAGGTSAFPVTSQAQLLAALTSIRNSFAVCP